MSISQISSLPQPPQRSDAPDIFAGRADTFVAALAPFVTETNQLGSELNQKADDAEAAASEAEQAKQEAEIAKDAALGAPSLVNYQGVWEAGTYNTGESVFHTPSDAFYISDEDGNTAEPASGAWRKVGTAESTTYDNSESGLNADNVQDAVDEVQSSVNNLETIPSGAVMNFAMPTAPTGWLKADGSDVSRSTYSSLFSAIGTTFGNGDGSSTFNLPDLRGEFLRGWDDGREIDDGRSFGSFQEDENKQHNHGGSVGSVGNHSHNYVGPGTGTRAAGSVFTFAATQTRTTDAGGSHSHSISNDGGVESRPRNIALLACIKI
jgi:microcystin-dependent protein